MSSPRSNQSRDPFEYPKNSVDRVAVQFVDKEKKYTDTFNFGQHRLHCEDASMTQTLNELDEKSVHLWSFSLDDCLRYVTVHENLLSKDERARAGRFHFEEDRKRYLASHGALRTILGTYLKREPCSILFRKSEAGKPEIIGDNDDPPITFNMSHSGSAVLVGVAMNRRIGVDIEQLSSTIDVVGIAEKHFTREEIAELRAKPEDDRYDLFYTLWTCKEAYLKAVGCGLSGGLQDVPVLGKDDERSISRGKGDGPRKIDHWTIRSLKLMDGYAAAVASEGTDLDLVMVRTLRN